MADLDLLQIDPQELIDLLKGAYYEQTGTTLQIGSDDFASASASAYVWSVLLNRINDATQNRFIATATGTYLDAIAENYGIEARPAGYHARAKFHLTLTVDGIDIPQGGIVVADQSGNQFTNPWAFYASSSGGTDDAVLEAVEPGTAYNGIPANSITAIVEGSAYISAVANLDITSGGTDGFPYTEEGDDAYREWLKTEIQSFAGAGTYQAYEARAKNSDPRILGVYVLRQDDDGYEKGKVQIYIHPDLTLDPDGQCVDIAQHSCEDPSFRPIGDLVVVELSPLTDRDIGKTLQVTYPARFSAIGASRTNAIIESYLNELRNTINAPFVFEELCARMVAKDADGFYALDAKFLSVTTSNFPLPIYPEPGARLNIQSLATNLKYDTRGA